MEGLLHDAWVLFVGIGSWMVNKLTAKLDGLEKGKADAGQINDAIKGISGKMHEIETVSYTHLTLPTILLV